MNSKNILIIDDSAMDRHLLATLVKSMGHTAVLCEDGADAIPLLRNQRHDFDLVLLDIVMPSIDGISVLGHYKSHYPDLPVVIISATTDPDDIGQIAKWKADAFISKPVSKISLENTLHKIALAQESAKSAEQLKSQSH